MEINRNNLTEVMEFDHVIEVQAYGTVTDDVPYTRNTWLPTLLDGELSGGDGWSLMDGYSGQYGYSGPIMHESEFIGGGMADDILSTPGYYVVIASVATTEEDAYDEDMDDDEEYPYDEYVVDGWAVAYKAKDA